MNPLLGNAPGLNKWLFYVFRLCLIAGDVVNLMQMNRHGAIFHSHSGLNLLQEQI